MVSGKDDTMKSIGNGQIEIESRKSEIEPLMMILDEWMAEHPDDEKQEVAQKLFFILDAMHMSW
jgi:hypothetical protein